MDPIEPDSINHMKGLKLVHINARSLFNKVQEIYNHYQNFDVIVITETWLNIMVPTSAVMLPQFRLVRQDRYKDEQKKGGGICIYVRDTCNIEDIDYVSEVTCDYEILGIKVKFANIKPCYLFGVYRPPKGKANELFVKLTKTLENLDLIRNEVYILGDMNIDYKSKQTIKRFGIKNFESRFNIAQVIDVVTRSTETTATTLDWIYTNSEYISNYGTINHNLSDHFPVFLVKKKKRNKIQKKTVRGRSYLRYDSDVFKEKLGDVDWDNFDNINGDPDMSWDIFQKNITKVLDEMCPIKNLTVPIQKPKWLNNEILVLMRKRDKTYRVARANNDVTTWRKARFLRNRVEMLIKNYKKEKIQGELFRHKNNPKKFWENIKEIWPRGETVTINGLQKDDSTELLQGEELAGHINDYFANVGAVLANNIESKSTCTSPLLYHTVLNNTQDNIISNPITTLEMLEAIKKIDVNKSSAVDNIRSVVIIDAFKSQLNRIVRLYNGSLTRCIFPACWKRGTIVPLPKVSNPKTANDMRPIALLPLPGKIMEHIISTRLKLYLDENKILTEKQHGFRKKKINYFGNCRIP